MYSLDYLLVQLNPHLPKEEAERLLLALDTTPGFDTKSWQKIQMNDLESETTKLGLIKTLFDIQSYYDGVASEIIRSLEEWSQDKTIIFPLFSIEDQEFYQRYYASLGWLFFDKYKLSTQIYLLGSRFLLLGCVWDVPIYTNVQIFFASVISLNIMEDHAIVFYEAMQNNKTVLAEEGKEEKSIAGWLVDFNEFTGSSPETKVDEFMSSKLEVSRLSPENQKYLYIIVTLYWSLRVGMIWKEIDYSLAPGVEPAEKKENKKADDYYLQILYKAEPEDFSEWLSSYKEVAEWLVLTSKSDEFIKKILFVLLEKVDLNNEKQVENTIDFINLLDYAGLDGIGNVIFFDETENKFKWNEDFFVSISK
ncbi:MAG TPA: hypothetical protein DEB09_01890 [Candidatus Magasanikbacteria bacterium]|nr:hypothetical protein [Candidatus Magasanikbacteria bacterium]